MRTFVLSSFVILLLSGCTSTNTASIAIPSSKPSLTRTQEETWKLMVGKWYGSQPITGSGTRKWIVERKTQGSYKILFRTYSSVGNFEESIESGQWGVSGPVYFSIFRGYNVGNSFSPVYPSDPYNYDAYKIIQLTNEVFKYESYATEAHFIVKRVPADFDFPK